MNKKMLIIIGVALLVAGAIAGGGYYWWASGRKASPVSSAQIEANYALSDIQRTVASVNSGMIDQLFAADTEAAGEAEEIPDLNPYRNANPFSDIRVNPFE